VFPQEYRQIAACKWLPKLMSLQIAFANGDKVTVTPAQLVPEGRNEDQYDWSDVWTENDGLNIAIEGYFKDLRVPWTVIRGLDDASFRERLTSMAQNQASWLGERLRRLREARGWTQLDLARAAHIPQANLSRIENGKSDVSNSTIWKILLAMGYSVQDLAGNKEAADSDTGIFDVVQTAGKR
jgi:DNA-binding XRE family transcriptional regulator